MKQTDSKDKSSVVLIGKGVIILSVIITASLSFALGFFVGKSTQPNPVIQTSVLPQPTAVPLKKEDPVQQPVPLQETGQPPISGITPKSSDIQQVRETNLSETAEELKPQRKTANPSPSGDFSRKDVHNSTQTRKYAVQVDAFKNASAAKSLADKLIKKGYRASVTMAKTKRHEKLYKVIVGDLGTRKEADALSSKMKRSENLQHAFVITKNDQEELR